MPAIPLDEFDQEMATTRRLIERVPGEKGEWKPHEKSFSLGHLTQLVATMPGWITQILEEPRLDLSAGPGYSYHSTAKLLATFDRAVTGARDALESTPEAELAKPWSLTMGEQVLFTSPKGATVRNTLSHLVHHRGQLTVYLRLLDIPVPSVYGPTADEGWGGAGAEPAAGA